MFADALKPQLGFLHGSLSAKKFLLLVAERGADFDEVDVLDAGC